MRHSFIEIFQIVCVSFVILLCIALNSDLMFKDHPLYYGEWMHFEYIKTVENFPSINPTAPFCWRLLVPFLVFILPLSTEIGFFVITYISLIACALIIYFIVKNLFNDVYYSWIGVFTYFSMIYVVRINVIEFIAVDPFVFVLMLLSIFSIYKRKSSLFIVSTILGVLTKEIMFIIFPLYFSINYKPHRERKYYYDLIAKTLLLSCPGVIVYLLLRLVVIPEGSYNYVDIIHGTIKYRIDSLCGTISTLNKDLFTNQNSFENSIINIYRISFGAIGPILFFIILKTNRIRNIIFDLSPLIILSFAQIFIAGDNERIVAVGFPAYILCYLFAIQSFVKDNGIDIKHFLIYSVLNMAIQIFLTKDLYWQTYYSIVAQLILGLLMIAVVFANKIITVRTSGKITRTV